MVQGDTFLPYYQENCSSCYDFTDLLVYFHIERGDCVRASSFCSCAFSVSQLSVFFLGTKNLIRARFHFDWLQRKFNMSVMSLQLTAEKKVDRGLLPPKKMLGKNSKSLVERRQKELELYLQTLLLQFPQATPTPLAYFLHFHLYVSILLLMMSSWSQDFLPVSHMWNREVPDKDPRRVPKLLDEVKIRSLQTVEGFQTVKCLNIGDFIIIKLLTQLNKGTSCRRARRCCCPIKSGPKPIHQPLICSLAQLWGCAAFSCLRCDVNLLK